MDCTTFYFIVCVCIFLYSANFKQFYHIEKEEIIDDFESLQMNDLNIMNCKYPMKEVHISSILLFLLSRDRLYAAYYSIKHWLRLYTSINLKIVILDHSTTYGPLLKYYSYLKGRYKIIIYHLKTNKWKECVKDEVPKVIEYYLNSYNHIKYYVLSDIDIVMLNAPNNIFDLYGTVLCNCKVNVIGPSLMINDISSKFPDYKRVYRYETHYMSTNHYDILYKGKYIAFINADIDTIFGMRKRQTKFVRQSKLSYRSLSPYIAHHIDWYISKYSVPKSFIYYVNHSYKINHSGSAFNLTNSLHQP